ncbi:hypothetical protein [Paraburkholderia aspalathi]|uniref:hypothetical protein n=1 Tax=Paraburkholderia aspalathi TaxID=1324617 RepID=UPI001B187E30|nr:hypothetical protein [Paraburkholderia aspalathi]CAE6842553.1 hypothetical protein R20943_07184 [Paraburkholderia aspalathi]
MQDTFTLALEARTTWAHFRIAIIASEGAQTGAVKVLADEAGACAQRLGFACYPDSTMPYLISDVPELIQRWSDGYAERADVQVQYTEFLAEYAEDRQNAEDDANQMRAEAGQDSESDAASSIAAVAPTVPEIDAETFHRSHARITKMADEAVRRCGLSHEYYVRLLCGTVEAMLLEFAPEMRPAIAVIAQRFDYVTPDELATAEAEMAAHGYCTHGLTAQTCPCGCFEH